MPMSRIAAAFLEILRSYLGTLPGARHVRARTASGTDLRAP